MARFEKHILIAFAVTAQLSLWGCAQQDSTNANARGISEALPHYLDTMSADRGKQTAMSGEVKCASGPGDADCSPSVAMFVSYTPNVDLSNSQVGQCTAFLIGPETVMTNGHCIPTDLKNTANSCNDRIWLYFPALASYPQVRVGCAQILTTTPSQSGVKAVADFAIIKLDQPVSRPALTISRDGFKDQNLYQMIKIDPLSTSAAIGSMTRTDCKAQHDSKMVPNSDDNLSPDMAMGDCPIAHGNSGSPLVDMQGQVHGLIQLTFEQNTLSAMFLQLSLPMVENSIGPLSAGTNLACLNLPGGITAPAIPPECSSANSAASAEASDQSEKQTLSLKVARNLMEEVSHISTESSELNPAFEWSAIEYKNSEFLTPTEGSNTQVMVTVPACIHDQKAVLEGHHSWLGGYDNNSDVAISLPKLSVKTGLNRYLVLDYQMNGADGAINAQLKFSPKDLSTKSSTLFTLTERDALGAEHTLFSQTLGPCPTSAAIEPPAFK